MRILISPAKTWAKKCAIHSKIQHFLEKRPLTQVHAITPPAPRCARTTTAPSTHRFLWKTYSMITSPPTMSSTATGSAMIRWMKFSYVAVGTRGGDKVSEPLVSFSWKGRKNP